jgi:hypothetical protein
VGAFSQVPGHFEVERPAAFPHPSKTEMRLVKRYSVRIIAQRSFQPRVRS